MTAALAWWRTAAGPERVVGVLAAAGGIWLTIDGLTTTIGVLW